jgi:hypothetical protein
VKNANLIPGKAHDHCLGGWKAKEEWRRQEERGEERRTQRKYFMYVGKMESSYSEYSPHLIHTILQQYKKGARGHGFRALAAKYNVKGGHKLVSFWYSKWDGTKTSLEKHSGGDRRSILTPKEKKKHVGDFIDKRSKVEAVTYAEVKENVEQKTGKAPALRTVKDYGKEFKVTSKKRKRVIKSQGLTPLCLCFFFVFALFCYHVFCVILLSSRTDLVFLL